MPELPEVERARRVVEDGALRRRIVDVDDTDTQLPNCCDLTYKNSQ